MKNEFVDFSIIAESFLIVLGLYKGKNFPHLTSNFTQNTLCLKYGKKS